MPKLQVDVDVIAFVDALTKQEENLLIEYLRQIGRIPELEETPQSHANE